MQIEPTQEREELLNEIKISLDNLSRLNSQCKTVKRDSILSEISMALAEELQKKIKELNAEIADMDQRRQFLAGKLSVLEKAYEVAINSELEVLDEETLGTKTERVRDLIRRRGTMGITRDEIREEFERQGLSLTKNYVYSTLFRLRKDDEITQKEDRYFWKAKTTA